NDERLRRMKRNSFHHFAVKPQIIMATEGRLIICPSGQSSFFSTFGTQTSCLRRYATKTD
ncbi:MAG: hypothetical protein J5760_02080, partial [Clostridia bacterium]|nr:hypothetical protein [Clostridia bacterium]